MASPGYPRQFVAMPQKKRRAATSELPNKIRKWREKAGFTLEAAAAEVDLTFGNLSAVERGAQGYSQKTLEALAKLYGAPDAGYLLSMDPDDDLFAIWATVDPAEQARILAVIKAMTGKG